MHLCFEKIVYKQEFDLPFIVNLVFESWIVGEWGKNKTIAKIRLYTALYNVFHELIVYTTKI